MKLYHKLSIVALIIPVLLVTFFLLRSSTGQKKRIAIIQTLSHPALESVRMGFLKEISNMQEEVSIKFYNAEGSVQSANLIAESVSKDKDVIAILAIGTLATQSIAKKEKIRPIVFAAVSDAKILGDSDNLKNVCGLTDALDADLQVSSILKILPDLKSISMLYSPHEANSVSQVSKLSASAKDRNIKIELFGVQSPDQIYPSSLAACKKSDAVLIPLDNTLVAAMPSVIKATKNHPCPIIASNESPIHQGASIAFAIDYEVIGQRAANIISRLISFETSIKDIGSIAPESSKILINQKVLKSKRININPEQESDIIFVGEEQ